MGSKASAFSHGGLCAALAAVLSIGGASAVLAADPAADAALKEATAKVVEIEGLAKQHQEAKADDALRVDITNAVKLAGELSDAKLKTRCIQIIGTIMKGTTHDDLERIALKAFGDLGNPAAGPMITLYLAQPVPDMQPPLLLDAIECAGKIKSDDNVGALLVLVNKSDILPVAAGALKALSNFGQSKRMREKILDELVGTVEKDRPGISYRWRGAGNMGTRFRTSNGIRTGEDARNRYEALAGEMCTGLNKLTGQNVASPEEWFDLRKKYKSSLAELFPKEK